MGNGSAPQQSTLTRFAAGAGVLLVTAALIASACVSQKPAQDTAQATPDQEQTAQAPERAASAPPDTSKSHVAQADTTRPDSIRAGRITVVMPSDTVDVSAAMRVADSMTVEMDSLLRAINTDQGAVEELLKNANKHFFEADSLNAMLESFGVDSLLKNVHGRLNMVPNVKGLLGKLDSLELGISDTDSVDIDVFWREKRGPQSWSDSARQEALQRLQELQEQAMQRHQREQQEHQREWQKQQALEAKQRALQQQAQELRQRAQELAQRAEALEGVEEPSEQTRLTREQRIRRMLQSRIDAVNRWLRELETRRERGDLKPRETTETQRQIARLESMRKQLKRHLQEYQRQADSLDAEERSELGIEAKPALSLVDAVWERSRIRGRVVRGRNRRSGRRSARTRALEHRRLIARRGRNDYERRRPLRHPKPAAGEQGDGRGDPY